MASLQTSPLWDDYLMPKWLVSLCLCLPVACWWVHNNASLKSLRKEPFLVAFQLICFVPMFHISVHGLNAWYSIEFSREMSVEERMFGSFEQAKSIGKIQIAFQIWDFVISMGKFELAQPEMLAHHMLTGVLAYWMLSIPYMQYYGIYFLGCIEFSSLPLCFVHLCKYYPEVKNARPMLYKISSLTFGVMFIWFRIVNWIILSINVWQDSLWILNRENVKGKLPLPREVVYSILLLNVLFTLLQFVWCAELYRKGVKTFLGGGR